MPGKHQMFITRVSRWLSGMTDCSRNHGGSIAQRVRRRENPKRKHAHLRDLYGQLTRPENTLFSMPKT